MYFGSNVWRSGCFSTKENGLISAAVKTLIVIPGLQHVTVEVEMQRHLSALSGLSAFYSQAQLILEERCGGSVGIFA